MSIQNVGDVKNVLQIKKGYEEIRNLLTQKEIVSLIKDFDVNSQNILSYLISEENFKERYTSRHFRDFIFNEDYKESRQDLVKNNFINIDEVLGKVFKDTAIKDLDDIKENYNNLKPKERLKPSSVESLTPQKEVLSYK